MGNVNTSIRTTGTEQESVYVVNITSVRRSERHTSLLGKTRTDAALKLLDDRSKVI